MNFAWNTARMSFLGRRRRRGVWLIIAGVLLQVGNGAFAFAYDTWAADRGIHFLPPQGWHDWYRYFTITLGAFASCLVVAGVSMARRART